MEFGICTTTDAYSRAYSAGADYVEFSGIWLKSVPIEQIRQVKGRIREDCPCIGCNAYCNENLPIVGENFCRESIYAYARDICEKGWLLGFRHIGIGSPAARRLPVNYDQHRADAQCEEFLRITASVASEYEIQVLLEPLNHTMCNYLLHIHEAVSMVQRICIPNLKILLDFYHMALENELPECMNVPFDLIAHTHISGYENDGSRYFLRRKDEQFCKECIDILRKNNYTRSLSIEADPEMAQDEMQYSLDMLRRTFAQKQQVPN